MAGTLCPRGPWVSERCQMVGLLHNRAGALVITGRAHKPRAGRVGRVGEPRAVRAWEPCGAGEVLADGGTEPGVTFVNLDLSAVDKARARVPSLSHDREFDGP